MNSAPAAPASPSPSDGSSRGSSRRAWLASLLAAALSAAAGGCGVSVEADVSDVQVTQHDIGIAGIPMAGRLGDVSTHFTFTQTMPNLDLPNGVESTVGATKVEFVATKGVTNLDFLKAVRVTMTPNESATPIELINYQKADGAVVGKSVTVDSASAVDVVKEWKTTAVFDLQVAGTLPETDWAVDLIVHFNGKLSYTY